MPPRRKLLEGHKMLNKRSIAQIRTKINNIIKGKQVL